MAQVNVHEAKSQLSKLLERAEAGEEIIIARAGKPVAQLLALCQPPAERKPGRWKGQIRIHEGFDELPAELQAAFDGETP